LQRYETPSAGPAIRKYLILAEKYGLDPAQMAIAFVNQQPFVTSNIIGATSMEQLKTNIAADELVLPDELLKGIEEVHLLHSNPCP
jgi:aryl-alcohol dehydrogenase-like predicted oxidoreductase